MALALRYAARSDVGLVRSENQDSGYAGPRLLVVADGMGGHAGGDVASSVTVAALAPLDDDSPGPDLLDRLAERMGNANARLREITAEEPRLTGMGTTVTAILRAGPRLGLAHIGDSRCYLLREGELTQITRDHSFVQTLVDQGRITAEEAAHHPQKNWIMRVLDGRAEPELDLSVREARVGDRYLLCSDGLSGLVSDDTIAEVLAAHEPAVAVDRLVELALRAGGPDNITCIIAEVVEVESDPPSSSPLVVGAASAHDAVRRNGDTPSSAAAKAAALSAATNGPADADEPESGDPAGRPRRRRRGRWLFLLLVVVLALAGGGWGAWHWSQTQFYVGEASGQVAIYRGISQSLGALELSSVYAREDIAVDALPTYSRERLAAAIEAADLTDARRIVAELRALADACLTQDASTVGSGLDCSGGSGDSP
jgi:protein phosphatase